MVLFRRSVKMKLKIALAVVFCAIIAVFVWYYVNTGQNPMVEIKKKVGTFVKKYYNNGDEDKSYENNMPRPTVSATTRKLLGGKQTGKTNTEGTSGVLTDQHQSLPSSLNTLKERPQVHALGHIALLNSHPSIPRMNALLASDAIDYTEGVLEHARRTFYREARPSNRTKEKFTVLFLHGIGLTSTIWINIGTFQILAELGYRALAVDLPGHGNSNDLSIPYKRDDILGYMTNLFTALDLHLPVMVSPSTGGEYAMPLLMAYPRILRGLVAIAPSDTQHYLISDYKKLSVPMLILFGEKDETMLHESSLDSLWYVPNRKIYMIKNTTHACYVDHPPTFHKLLIEFLHRVE